MLLAALHEFGFVQVLDAVSDDLTTRCGGQRPKSAKARNRDGG